MTKGEGREARGEGKRESEGREARGEGKRGFPALSIPPAHFCVQYSSICSPSLMTGVVEGLS